MHITFKDTIKIITSWDYFVWSLRILLPALLILAVALITHYEINTNKDRSELLAKETLNVELMQEVMSDEIFQLVTDLKILLDNVNRDTSKSREKQHRLYSQDLVDQFITFSKIRGVYDQIRIIDLQGNEVIRVNYDNGNAFSVPASGLQNKSSRYYLKNTLKTAKNNIYISPLDLNIENNIIEQPQQPTLRFGTPIYDPDNKLIGALILNYNGFHLLNHFVRTANQLSDNIMLVAPNGFWMISPKSADKWTFLTKEQKTFDSIHPTAWPQIENSQTQQFSNAKGIYTFATIDNHQVGLDELVSSHPEKAQTFHWKVVSFIDQNSLNTIRQEFFDRNKYFYLAILILITIATIIITFLRTKHLHSLEQILFERHFKNSLENIQLAAITLDQNGKILFCNHYFADKVKAHNEQIINDIWIELFVTDSDKTLVKNKISKILNSPYNLIEPFECKIKTNSNKVIIFEWNATIAVDAVGEIFGVTLIGKDITQEKETSDLLRKLSAAVEQSPNTVMISDLQGSIEYVNPKFTQLTGYAPDEVKGKNPSILKSGETNPDEYSTLWKTIKKGGTWSGIFHNKKKSGELYWEATHISPLRDKQGEITHYLAIKEDITSQRELESVVIAKNNELMRNRELASVGKMANMIAHDIRNPLTTIKMALQIFSKQSNISSTNEQQEHQELVQISLEQTAYMEAILSDLLSYSRPDELRQQWINIDNLIHSTLTGLHRIVSNSEVNIELEIQKGLPTVFADPIKMRQVLSNLIHNAIQASESNSNCDPVINIEASLSLGECGTGLEIIITDNGCGIEDEKLESIFEPFVTTKAKGTGLGLAIVARIIEQHQGTITLSNRKSAGVIASINLPINPPQNHNKNKAEKNYA